MKKNKSQIFRVLSYVKPHWYLIIVATVAGILKLTLPLILPQVVKYFTDVVLVPNTTFTHEAQIYEVVKWTFILLVFYTIVYIPAAFVRQRGATEVSNRIMNTMRCQLYEHLQKMSAKFHQEYKSGNLVTRINSDVEGVHIFIWNVATNVWIDGIVIIIYIILMGSMNIPLTIIACIALPTSVIITKKIRAHIRSNSKQVQANISEISGYMQERMTGYSTVRLFNMEQYEKRKFDGYSNLIYQYLKKTNKFFSLGEAINASFSEVISTIIVGLSALFIIGNQMTIGELIVFQSYLSYFMTPLRRFAELNVSYAQSIAKIERVFEILDMPADIRDAEDAIDFEPDEPANIQFKNVYFKYELEQKNWNISNLNLSINEGERVAIVGSSGCGKTTLISLLTRFYDVNKGSICIGNNDIKHYKLSSVYHQMGMVFQDTIIFSGTIEENIRYGKQDASQKEIEKAAKLANAYDFIMNSPNKWQTILGERGIGLSGGQKQRIAIARIFLRNPRILILDEATSALDSESELLVQQALDQLMKGRTSIVIAHRLSTIINADKIVVMDNGEIVEIGTHKDLLEKNGRYAELYNLQYNR